MIKTILSSSFWLLVGNSIGRLAMFVANVFAARILSQEIFGQFMMIRSTINMGANFVSSALATSAIKKISELRIKNPPDLFNLIIAIFILNSVVTIFFSVILVLFSNFIIDNFFLGDTNLLSAIYIGILLLLGITLSTVVQGILIGFEEFRELAYISVFVSVISIPVIISTIYFFELNGALFGVFFYFILDFLLKLSFLKKKIGYLRSQIVIKKILAASSSLVFFSTPIVFSIILNSVSFWYARVIILNNSKAYSDIAIFDAAYQWLTIIMLITGATTSVALPMLSKAFGKNNKKELKRIFYFNLIVNVCISISIAFIFILFSKQIMSLYGTEYIEGSLVLIILSITSVLFSISSIYNKYMVAQDRAWIIFIASIIGTTTLFIILDYFLHLKAVGLSLAFLSFYGSMILTFILAK